MDYIDDVDNDSNASFATRSSASSTSKRFRNNSGQGTKIQSSMNDYIGRKLYPNEMNTFYKLLLRMTVSNGWAFQWVENQETIDFFNFISPLLQLPNRKTLANEILKNSAENVQKNIEAAAKEDKYGVSISLDGWKNVIKQNILGLVITRSDGQVLIWGAKDISGDRGNTNAAVKHISMFLNETQAKDIKINTVITDSASSYNAAR
jgi:hypothetical protein